MKLARHQGSTENWSILEACGFPFITSNSPEDTTWECICGRVLATGLYRRQLQNLLIRCSECSALLETLLRSPGEPLPAAVYIPPNTDAYPVSGINIPDVAVVLAGRAALEGYARETGRHLPDIYVPDLAPVILGLGIESCEVMVDRLTALLGDRYEDLQRADDRGLRSNTPPAARHRLIELIAFCRSLAAAQRSWDGKGHVGVSAELLAECITTLHVADRWKHHPSWEVLRTALASETEHTIMLLAVASYLVDANNGIGVHEGSTEQGAKLADLWLEPNLKERVDLEVKTPVAFRNPTEPITKSKAESVIKRCVRKSSSQRQTRSSLLIVGGYHLEESFPIIVEACKTLLEKERHRWVGLAGILLADCRSTAGDGLMKQGDAFSPSLRVDVTLHPGYAGEIEFSQGPPQQYLPPSP